MKTYQSNKFIKSVKKLKDKELKLTIFAIIQEVKLQDNLINIKSVKKIVGYENYYRIRIGKYRIGIKYDKKENAVIFSNFAHRSKIYNIFP